MDILKQLSNPNLFGGTAKTTAMTVPMGGTQTTLIPSGWTPPTTSQFDAVQDNNTVTPGQGYSPYSDAQVAEARRYAYSAPIGPVQPVQPVQVSPQAAPQPVQSPYQAPYQAPQAPVQPAQQAPQAPTGENSFDPGVAKRALINQYMTQKFGQTGMFDKQGYTQYSPEQLGSIQNSADTYFGGAIDEMQKLQDQQNADNEISTSMTLNGQSYNLSKTQLKTLNTLNPQFEQLIKEPMGVVKASQSISQLREIAQADPAGQMALIFSFMKSLDPSSTVREGEYANAENTRGVPDTIRNWYNKMQSGTFLTPQQVESFAKVSMSQADAARQQIRATASDFDVKAGFNGLPSGLFAAQISNRVGDIANNFSGTMSGQPADIVNLSSQNPVRDLIDYKQRIANIESGASADIYGNKPNTPNWNQYAVKSTYGTERKRADGTKYVDYAYGKYQMMGEYIPGWSKAALGRTLTPQQLMQNPDAQEKIMDYLAMQGYNRAGNWNDAAAIHFSGRPLAGNTSQDAGGTSVMNYVAGLYTGKNAGGNIATNAGAQGNSSYSGKLSSGLTYEVVQ